MKLRLSASLPAFLIVASLSTVPAHAAKDADLKPALATPGKVMAEDAFGTAEVGKPWTANKGTAEVKDGALVETFKEEDHHPAVLTLGVPNHNSIIKFSFKMQDATSGFALSYNSAEGHLFRVLVTGDGVNVVKDVEKEKGAKPKGKGKAKSKAASTPIKTAAAADAPKGEAGAKAKAKTRDRSANAFAKVEGKISASEWHTMLVEVKGTKVCVQVDGLKAEGEHSAIDVDKTGYRFVTSTSVTVDDVKVWGVE